MSDHHFRRPIHTGALCPGRVRAAVIAAPVLALSIAACGSTASSSGTTSTTEHVAQQSHESLTRPALAVVNPVSPSSVTAATAVLPESRGHGANGWLAVGTRRGSHLGMVLGASPIKEGRSSNVVITVTPSLGPGAYVVGIFRTRSVPTPSDAPLVLQSVTVAGA